MAALLEQLASRKLGVAVVAMFLLAQGDLSETAALLIAGIAALHLICQTVLDVWDGHDSDRPPVNKEGLLDLETAHA